MTATRINLQPTDAYRRETYGVLFESETRHSVRGPLVHNASFPHRIDVWENKTKHDPSSRFADAEGNVRLTPYGHPTADRYSYLLAPQAVAIVRDPAMRDHTPEGPVLAIGDEVELAVHGYVLGTFRVEARRMADPILVAS